MIQVGDSGRTDDLGMPEDLGRETGQDLVLDFNFWRIVDF